MSNAVIMHTIGFIGGGRMAEALISGVLTARLFEPGKIRVADPDATRQDHLKR
ncbi:MAG: NAD(P)-binding domain-containing protein, partial [Nitrospira sp.]|nr:NAD(P)-binding domain-containing protein [Nitrospira sp.]